MTHVTCRLTAKNRDQHRNPTLGNRVWATLPFYIERDSQETAEMVIGLKRQRPTSCCYAHEQVCVQLSTSADSVTIPAFAATRRAAARLLLTAGPPHVQQPIESGRAHSGKPAAAACHGRMGQIDGRTPDSCLDPSPHTMRAVPIIVYRLSNSAVFR